MLQKTCLLFLLAAERLWRCELQTVNTHLHVEQKEAVNKVTGTT